MSYVPFPLGTVRGPYSCGLGYNARGGVQYMVNGRNGWITFIRPCSQEGEARKDANKMSKKILRLVTYKKIGHSWNASRGNVVGKGDTKTEALRQLKAMEKTLASLTDKNGQINLAALSKVKISVKAV
jgi:hypothetical protein